MTPADLAQIDLAVDKALGLLSRRNTTPSSSPMVSGFVSSPRSAAAATNGLLVGVPQARPGGTAGWITLFAPTPSRTP